MIKFNLGTDCRYVNLHMWGWTGNCHIVQQHVANTIGVWGFAERLVRGWRRADRNKIRRLLRASRLSAGA